MNNHIIQTKKLTLSLMINTSDRLQQLENFLADSPNDTFILFAIAKEHEGLENTDEAIRFYRQLEKDHADYVGTYYHLGKILEKTEGIDAAIKVYKKGMDVAKAAGDRHALSELAGARMEIDEEMD